MSDNCQVSMSDSVIKSSGYESHVERSVEEGSRSCEDDHGHAPGSCESEDDLPPHAEESGPASGPHRFFTDQMRDLNRRLAEGGLLSVAFAADSAGGLCYSSQTASEDEGGGHVSGPDHSVIAESAFGEPVFATPLRTEELWNSFGGGDELESLVQAEKQRTEEDLREDRWAGAQMSSVNSFLQRLDFGLVCAEGRGAALGTPGAAVAREYDDHFRPGVVFPGVSDSRASAGRPRHLGDALGVRGASEESRFYGIMSEEPGAGAHPLVETLTPSVIDIQPVRSPSRDDETGKQPPELESVGLSENSDPWSRKQPPELESVGLSENSDPWSPPRIQCPKLSRPRPALLRSEEDPPNAARAPAGGPPNARPDEHRPFGAAAFADYYAGTNQQLRPPEEQQSGLAGPGPPSGGRESLESLVARLAEMSRR